MQTLFDRNVLMGCFDLYSPGLQLMRPQDNGSGVSSGALLTGARRRLNHRTSLTPFKWTVLPSSVGAAHRPQLLLLEGCGGQPRPANERRGGG